VETPPMSLTATASLAYCRRILPGVSRTFALTIPTLQEPLQSRVGVSYLLCRIADTIEDRAGLTREERLDLFTIFRGLLRAPGDPALRDRFQTTWPRYADAAHQDLMENAGAVLDCFETFPGTVRAAVTDCMTEMMEGMAAFSNAGDADSPVTVCSSLEDLERYCHCVAGTVGILLSRLFAGELEPGWLTPERLEQGRRFGLGLQLTNVLKDQGTDRRRGISYVPDRWLDGAGISADGRRLLILRAVDHLEAGQAYIVSLPAARADMRLFCLWAAHLALATLRLAAGTAAITAGTGGAGSPGPVKVSREAVWEILEAARAAVTDDGALDALHRKYAGDVHRALA